MGRGIALLFHDHGNRREWLVSSTPRPHFTPGTIRYPLYRRLGGQVWTGGKYRPNGIRSPDRPARSQSLYRLSYPAHPDRFTSWKWPRCPLQRRLCELQWRSGSSDPCRGPNRGSSSPQPSQYTDYATPAPNFHALRLINQLIWSKPCMTRNPCPAPSIRSTDKRRIRYIKYTVVSSRKIDTFIKNFTSSVSCMHATMQTVLYLNSWLNNGIWCATNLWRTCNKRQKTETFTQHYCGGNTTHWEQGQRRVQVDLVITFCCANDNGCL